MRFGTAKQQDPSQLLDAELLVQESADLDEPYPQATPNTSS
jgi:hypothetical protein